MLHGNTYYWRLNRPAQVMQLVLIALLLFLPLTLGKGAVFSLVQTTTTDKGQINSANRNTALVNPNSELGTRNSELGTRNSELGTPSKVTKPQELPQGLYQTWMQTQAQEAVNNNTYHLEAAGAGEVQGHNPAQSLELSFQASGVKINGMNLSLVGIGYQGQALETLAKVAPIATDNRVEYQRSADLTEWYLNNANGLEQGFTLTQAWPGQNGNELALELSLTGGLFQSAGGGLEMIPDKGSVTSYGGLYAYDATGRALPSRMEVSGEGQTTHILVNVEGVQYPITIDPLVQRQQLTPSDGTPNDNFGSAAVLSSDGKTALIGASDKTITGTNGISKTNQGAAYIFVRALNGTWSQQGSALIASNGEANDYFGTAVALSSDGNTALIGAYNKTITGTNGISKTNQGAAYIFVRTNGSWSQQGSALTSSDGAANDNFGSAVALSGDGNTALIGAYHKNFIQGAAYIYVRTLNGSWSQQWSTWSTLRSGRASFGFAVALSSDGNTALIGSPEGGGYPQYAYIYVRALNGTWSQQGVLDTTSVSWKMNLDFFGSAVALSGDGNTALIISDGRYQAFEPVAAYFYVRTNGTWSNLYTWTLWGWDYCFIGFCWTSAALSSDGNTVLIGFKDGRYDQIQYLYDDHYKGQEFGTTSGTGSTVTDSMSRRLVSLSGDGNTALIGSNILVNLPAAATTLTANPFAGSNYGQTVKLTTTISPTNATGTVAFLDNGTPLSGSPVAVTNGVASLTSSNLIVGSHIFTATYSGDGSYAGSTSSEVAYTVNAVTSRTTLTASPFAGSNYGQAVTLTATISPAGATGTVAFMDGSTTLSGSPVAVTNGVATLTLSNLIIGNHTFTATYSGDSNFVGSTGGNLNYTVYTPLVVSSSTDNGTGNTLGTLSYALTHLTNPPVAITFSTNSINFTGPLIPSVPAGVAIDGGSICSSPPAVTINGGGVSGDGLVLNGNNFLRNIWVKGFANRQITTSALSLAPWVKNRLQCVKVSR
ncbi:MAG: Ig-like domain repeat protein [Chloroflexi bacterium]|nr:Ig-like domain repeat protein [Chloroflexota bacterium]